MAAAHDCSIKRRAIASFCNVRPLHFMLIRSRKMSQIGRTSPTKSEHLIIASNSAIPPENVKIFNRSAFIDIINASSQKVFRQQSAIMQVFQASLVHRSVGEAQFGPGTWSVLCCRLFAVAAL